MITKTTAQRIESEMMTVNSPEIPTIQQFEALLRVGLILGRANINLIDFTQNLWDNSGAGPTILSTPDGEAAPQGQYDTEYLRKVQVMYLSFKNWFANPISADVLGNTVTLSETPRQLIMASPQIVTPTT